LHRRCTEKKKGDSKIFIYIAFLTFQIKTLIIIIGEISLEKFYGIFSKINFHITSLFIVLFNFTNSEKIDAEATNRTMTKTTLQALKDQQEYESQGITSDGQDTNKPNHELFGPRKLAFTCTP